MYNVAAEAVARARRGEGPTLIEAKTHRRGGHAEGEEAFLAGQQYRSAEEKADALQKDPLLRLHEYVITQQVVAVETLETLDQQITQEVVDAVAYARSSPDPDTAILFADGWVESEGVTG